MAAGARLIRRALRALAATVGVGTQLASIIASQLVRAFPSCLSPWLEIPEVRRLRPRAPSSAEHLEGRKRENRVKKTGTVDTKFFRVWVGNCPRGVVTIG